MTRIHDLAERRCHVWARPWADWTPDYEGRIRRLSQLLEEAYAERRLARAQGPIRGGLNGKERQRGEAT